MALGLLLCTLACTHALRADESSEPAPLATQSLLLGVAAAGTDLVAVGDRGCILVSSNHGLAWVQKTAPTRAMLTAVSFPDPQHGWAVGHDGVILATTDGGENWQRQDNGHDLNTVWLDVLFLSPTHGFVCGAYGKFIGTQDGGKTWHISRPTQGDVHYNSISAGNDGYLYVAGEAGTLLVSKDAGKNWTASAVPYDGSLFGVLPLDRGRIVCYGLRGHILRSDDHGATWAPLPANVPALIMGGTRLFDGTVVLGGQGGNFFISRDAGQSFSAWKPAGFGASIAALVPIGDGWILAVGEGGAVRLKLP